MWLFIKSVTLILLEFIYFECPLFCTLLLFGQFLMVLKVYKKARNPRWSLLFLKKKLRLNMAPLPNRKSVDKKRVYLVSPGFSSLCQTIVSVLSQLTTTILFSGLSGFSRLFLRVTLQTYLPCFKSILLFCTVYRKLIHT